MSQKHNMAKNILDASFYKICKMFQYKSREEEKYYYQVDTYYLSSKICSCFGK